MDITRDEIVELRYNWLKVFFKVEKDEDILMWSGRESGIFA